MTGRFCSIFSAPLRKCIHSWKSQVNSNQLSASPVWSCSKFRFISSQLDGCYSRNKMGAGMSSLSNSKNEDKCDSGVTGTYTQKQANEDDTLIADVCSESEMRDGEMKEFSIGEKNAKILMVKEHGQYYALGTKCSHYGAPLVKGVYANGQITCPWHGACFNSKTGDIEDHPGLDSLPKYQVNIKEGRVIVTAEKSLLKSNKRQRNSKKNLCGQDKSDSAENQQTFLIIGGGGAASSCVEELRYQSFSGKVIMATQESFLPYDRPKLSKALDTSGDKLVLRSQEFYESLNIQVLLNKKAVKVNSDTKTVKFSDESEISYDKLVLATGGTPRKCTVSGSDLNNIFYLRSPIDGNKIAETAKDKDLIIIGNSFIGMEVAAYFATKAKSVSIVARSDLPFKFSLGSEIGERIKQWFETKERIKFYHGQTVDEFIGDENGNISSVKLTDGTVLSAQACIVGIGVVPQTNYLANSGIEMNDKQEIIVDKFLQTSNSDVFAAGDIVSFPLTTFNNERVNIGHWQLAQYHGKVAALNILDKSAVINTIPFFWCMMFGKSIRFAGYNKGYDDIFVDGSLEDMTFAVYYFKNDFAVSVATMGMDPISSYFSAYLKSGKRITKDEIRANPKGWMPQSP